MAASLRILREVSTYRLRRLEVGTLAAAGGVGVVLRLPPAALALRLGAATLLGLLVHLRDDDLAVALEQHTDRAEADRARTPSAHWAEARRLRWGVAAAALLMGAAGGGELLLELVVGMTVFVGYAARRGRAPVVDVGVMALGGVCMAMVGSPIARRLGWEMAVQFGLFCAVFETLRVLRDHHPAERGGPGALTDDVGAARTIVASRLLMLLAATFAATFLDPVLGVALAAAIALPISAPEAEADATRLRAFYGACWLVCCGWLWQSGHAAGLLSETTRGELVPLMGGLADAR